MTDTVKQKDVYDAVERSESHMERKIEIATHEIKKEILALRAEMKQEYLLKSQYKAEIKPILKLFWGVLLVLLGTAVLEIIRLAGK